LAFPSSDDVAAKQSDFPKMVGESKKTVDTLKSPRLLIAA
jgi:hypothetical protein